jgi:hypothetical protein
MVRGGRPNALRLDAFCEDWKTLRNRFPLLSPKDSPMFADPLLRGATASNMVQ